MPNAHLQPLLSGLADGTIALAFVTLAVELLLVARTRRTSSAFRQIYGLFAIFILACGVSHALEVWTLWHPDYWIAGGAKATTAALALFTAVILARAIPKILNQPTRHELTKVNFELAAARDAAAESARAKNMRPTMPSRRPHSRLDSWSRRPTRW